MPKAQTLTKPANTAKKKTVKRRAQAALATCPVNGAGWCPYPFSVEQLERRLKEKAATEAAAKKAKEVP